MKPTFLILSATLALGAAAQRSSGQDRNRLNVVPAVREPAKTDSVLIVDSAAVAAPIDTAKPTAGKKAKAKTSFLATAPNVEMQNYRPEDKRGINVFEAPKDEGIGYDGFKLQWGAAFTQQFQGLDHSNTASPNLVTTAGVTTDANQLIRIGHGPNTATANLYLNGQLAPGIRVAMTTYCLLYTSPSPRD